MHAMQCNAIQCNAIQYVHTYIYIHISFFRGIPDLQTNQFSRLCSTDLLRGFLVLCSLEWRMRRLRRQQASGDSQVSPANGDPVFAVSSNAGHPDEACKGRGWWQSDKGGCRASQEENDRLGLGDGQEMLWRALACEGSKMLRHILGPRHGHVSCRPQCVDGQSQNKLPQFSMFNTLFSH